MRLFDVPIIYNDELNWSRCKCSIYLGWDKPHLLVSLLLFFLNWFQSLTVLS